MDNFRVADNPAVGPLTTGTSFSRSKLTIRRHYFRLARYPPLLVILQQTFVQTRLCSIARARFRLCVNQLRLVG
jgi:hypothetical protein